MSQKRSKKAVIGEFLIWFAVAVITAVVLALLSNSLLPESF